MEQNRKIFFEKIGQTSLFPLALEVDRAEGIYIYDTDGKRYIDMISGISVSNLGHGNHNIIEAIEHQISKYMHTMVYGEHIQTPQTLFTELITSMLPPLLNSVFFTNSGAEATEGAMKLAKRYTSRYEIVVCRNGYHGNTHGAQSLMDNEYLSQRYRPFVPGIRFIEFNGIKSLEKITKKTACVITEVVQADSGVRLPDLEFLKTLRAKCDETGALLIFDEIQTGFGRTGKLFAFEHYKVIPDIMLIAKAMGGGLPAGALIADRHIMETLSYDPILGYISTFGGNPVCIAAGYAALKELLRSGSINEVEKKANFLNDSLKGFPIVDIRYKGLLFALEFENSLMVKKIVLEGVKNGILVDWFLYNDRCIRLAPPLTINEEELSIAVDLLKKSMSEI